MSENTSDSCSERVLVHSMVSLEHTDPMSGSTENNGQLLVMNGSSMPRNGLLVYQERIRMDSLSKSV